MRLLTRRAFALAGFGGAGASLAGCAAMRDVPIFGAFFPDEPREVAGPVESPDYARVYRRLAGEPAPVPAFDYTNTDPMFLRSNVAYAGREPPGTVIVDPRRWLLYLVEPRGRATRYGIGIGPGGSGFSGPAQIGGRETWPDRAVATAARASGSGGAWARLASTGRETRPKAGGARHPLGARLMPVLVDGRDIGLAIHGTDEPQTVGSTVAAGSIRMINQDVIDLFDGVAEGAPVLVLA